MLLRLWVVQVLTLQLGLGILACQVSHHGAVNLPLALRPHVLEDHTIVAFLLHRILPQGVGWALLIRSPLLLLALMDSLAICKQGALLLDIESLTDVPLTTRSKHIAGQDPSSHIIGERILNVLAVPGD